MNPFGLLKRCYLAEDATGQKTATNQQRASAEGEQRSATRVRENRNVGGLSSSVITSSGSSLSLGAVSLINRAVSVVVDTVRSSGGSSGSSRSGGGSGSSGSSSSLSLGAVSLINRAVSVVVDTVRSSGGGSGGSSGSSSLGAVILVDYAIFIVVNALFVLDHDDFAVLGDVATGLVSVNVSVIAGLDADAVQHRILGDTELLGDLGNSVAVVGGGVSVSVIGLLSSSSLYQVTINVLVLSDAVINVIVAVYRRLGESRSSRNQHHSQHSRQQHQFPQCTYLL